MPPNCCITIAPLKLTASEATIRSAIQFSSVLPPPGQSLLGSNVEAAEIAHLSSALGWLDPRGLYGYSEASEYKDLYVYFDYGDKTSPVNELATKAFKMYGLGGAMVNGKPTWGKIRGSVVIVRLEPDLRMSPDAVHNPVFTVDEMYNTLVFFRDAEASAHKIALKRDAARFMKSQASGMSSMTGQLGLANAYFGPGGSRTMSQLKDDTDKCAKCGKPQSLVGRLKRCQACQKTYYCSKECQRIHWKVHKKVCRSL